MPSPRPGERRANEGGAAADSGAELGASPPGSAVGAGRQVEGEQQVRRGGRERASEPSGAGLPSRPTALTSGGALAQRAAPGGAAAAGLDPHRFTPPKCGDGRGLRLRLFI